MGTYRIAFDFRVDDRYVSITPGGLGFPVVTFLFLSAQEIAVGTALENTTTKMFVLADVPFMLLIY